MSFLENIGYLLVGFVIIIAVFLLILAILEKKLKIKFVRGKTSPNQEYIKKISKVKTKKPTKALKELDKIAKSFFKEAFHIQGAQEYSTLEEIFAKRKNKKATQFSETMTQFLYSKKDPTQKDTQSLVTQLAEIVAANKIITKEEKQALDKKSQEKNPLRKRNILSIAKKKFKKKQDNSKKK